MKISSQLKEGIYEVSFRYHSKLDGYAKYCRYTEVIRNREQKAKNEY